MIGKLKNFWSFGSGRMAMATFCAQSVSISIGLCQGYSAILLPQLNEPDSQILVDQDEGSWIASLGTVTNPLGAILSGIFAEYLGRKRSIQISCFPFIVGWLMIGCAQNINWLYAGRLISGIGGGMSSASYTYVSEISTTETRGVLNSLGPVCGSLGISIVYILGYCCRWSVTSFLCIIFAVFTLVSMQFLPESPAFLIKAGEKTNSFQSYFYFRRNNALAQQEIDNHQMEDKDRTDDDDWRKVYLKADTIKPFLILNGLFLLQEASGIYAILFYAVNFFEEAELTINNNVSSIILAVLRLTMSLVSVLLVKKFGRKILCIVSSSGMTLSLLMLSVYYKYYEINSNETRILPMFPLFGVLVYVTFSTIGLFNIPFLLNGEMFPLATRPIMSGIVSCMAQTFIFLSVKAYPYMIKYLHFSGTLIIFLIASFLAIIYSKFALIETKNKSLLEIKRHFGKEELVEYDNKAYENSEIHSQVITVHVP